MKPEYPHSSKISLSNSRQTWHEVHVEPWANDYTLFPGEDLEIHAYGNEAVPWFHIVEWDGVSQVYCEATADFMVVQKGIELQCGHNRQPGSRATESVAHGRDANHAR
jgi:hypothetical protein